MCYFPLFINLEGKRVLVVGGGTVAARRICALLPFGCDIRVVAPEAVEEIRKLVLAGKVSWSARPYDEGDCQGAFLVLAATDCGEVNREACASGRRAGALVNRCDRREACDFYFPGLAVDGDLTVGICSGGADHKKARMVSKAVRAMLSKRDWRKEEGQNEASHPSGKPGERPGGSADEAGDRPIAGAAAGSGV